MLRPYQQQLVQDVRLALRSNRRVLTVLPTGGGKTQVFCTIADLAAQRGRRVLILVHRRELLAQTVSRLDAMDICRDRIAVHSIQSRQLPDADLLIVDEAHHSAAKTWKSTLDSYSVARVVGFTATPQRLDGKGLSDVFDVMVEGPDVAALIDAGYLSKYKLFCPPGRADLAGVRKRAGDYARGELEQRVDQRRVIAAAVKNYQLLAGGRQAIGFCVSLAHMEHVRATFAEADIPAATVDGGMSKAARDAVIGQFRSGAVRVLLSVDLISEGFDVPACDCVLLMRPTTSLGLHLQQIGRGLRPGERECVILDCAGNSELHGLPGEPRNWSLQGITKERSGGVDAVAVRVCPQCFAVHRPAAVCPYCGHVHAVEQRMPAEAEMELVDRTAELKAKRREVGMARSREQLLEIAKKRGYKPGWVENVMRSRILRAIG